jgi:outer membrane lipoprotein SlyB
VTPRTVRTSSPTYRTAAYEPRPVQTTRSWKKSALIIGGGAAAGAGLGAVIDGGSGAKKGAVIGGVAGTVYDLATRNKTRYE